MMEQPPSSPPFIPVPPRRQDMPPFEALRVFDAVARQGGIRKAANSLDRDHAVVSRHLRSLETWLGVQLIDRRPSGSILTPEGVAYHAVVATAMDNICRASLDLLNQGHHSELSIYCAPGFAFHWLSGRLDAFEEKNTNLALVLKPSEESPDFSLHEADVDIRFVATYEDNPAPHSLVRDFQLARVPIIAVCSPDYLDKQTPINTPQDLLDHSLLHEDGYETWANWLGAYGVEQTGEWSGPRLSQGHITFEAARRGRGIALANLLTASRDLERGRLSAIGLHSEHFPPLYGEYVLYMRADRWDDQAPLRFRQWLKRTIAKDLKTSSPDPTSGDK